MLNIHRFAQLLLLNDIKYNILVEPITQKITLHVPMFKLTIYKFGLNNFNNKKNNYYIFVKNQFITEIHATYFTTSLFLIINKILKIFKNCKEWPDICENVNIIQLFDRIFDLYGTQLYDCEL